MPKSTRSFQRIGALTTVPVSSSSASAAASSVPSVSSSQTIAPIVVRQQLAGEVFSQLQQQPQTSAQRSTHAAVVVDRPRSRNSVDVSGASSARYGQLIVQNHSHGANIVGTSVQQPVVIAEEEPELERRRRTEREWDGTMSVKRARDESALDELRAEKERLAREISELRREKESLEASRFEGQQQRTIEQRPGAEQVVVVVPPEKRETRRQQSWPLVLRRLLLVEQALHAEASKKSSRDKHLQQQQQQQQNRYRQQAAAATKVADQKPPGPSLLAKATRLS